MNQCDGCRRNLPVNSGGIHVGQGWDFMACTKHIYQSDDRLKKLQSENDQLKARDMSEWISIEDRMPLYDEAVLIANENNIGHARLRRNIVIDYFEIVSSNYREPKASVTHWMPLPNAPEQER